MSYILDALQKSDAENSPEILVSQSPTATTGLALSWKLAIGAMLATNLLLIYLWRSELWRSEDTNEPATASQAAPTDRSETASNSRPANVPLPSSTRNASTRTGNSPKRTLPGIAAPREIPTPEQMAASAPGRPTNPGAARTFRPTGAPITIADARLAETQMSEAAPAEREPAAPSAQPRVAQPPIAQPPIAQPPIAQPPIAQPSQALGPTKVSQLSQLSTGALESLYVLTFSTHIYGSDSDLRAVVVNGQRLTEGKVIIAENGQEFLLQEITDDGVIMQFEHEGATERVEIPVMEDWKDA